MIYNSLNHNALCLIMNINVRTAMENKMIFLLAKIVPMEHPSPENAAKIGQTTL